MQDMTGKNVKEQKPSDPLASLAALLHPTNGRSRFNLHVYGISGCVAMRPTTTLIEITRRRRMRTRQILFVECLGQFVGKGRTT